MGSRERACLEVIHARGPDANAQPVTPDRIVSTDSVQVYDVLAVSEFQPKRVKHSQTVVSKRGHPITGREHFGNQSKRHLRRGNGILKNSWYWCLKECEGGSPDPARAPCVRR